MKAVNFVHSNTKQQVEIFPEKVFAVTFLPTNQSTVLIADAGAMVPVEGTVEHVSMLVEAGKKMNQEINLPKTKAKKGAK